MKNTKAVIRDMQAYNSMLEEIKAVIAAEGVEFYKIIEDRNVHLYGGTMCYDHSSSGAYTEKDEILAFSFDNTVGTISSDGIYDEYPINHISVDFALKNIKSSLKEAFSAPAFVGNDEELPNDDDGMWFNNHRLVPSTIAIEVNSHIWSVNFQD